MGLAHPACLCTETLLPTAPPAAGPGAALPQVAPLCAPVGHREHLLLHNIEIQVCGRAALPALACSAARRALPRCTTAPLLGLHMASALEHGPLHSPHTLEPGPCLPFLTSLQQPAIDSSGAGRGTSGHGGRRVWRLDNACQIPGRPVLSCLRRRRCAVNVPAVFL